MDEMDTNMDQTGQLELNQQIVRSIPAHMIQMVTVVVLQDIMDSSDSETEDDTSPYFHMAASATSLPRRNQPRPRHRQRGYVSNVVSNFRLDEYKTFFRVDRGTVQCLQDWISRTCDEENITGITEREGTGGCTQKPLGDRILMTLWFMASLDKYSSVADRFGMSESTACCAVRNLIHFIQENLLEKIVVWPSATEQQEIKEMYEELKGFPGVIGMIDGTHIKIRMPKERGIDYYNRKEYYSVVLQGVVREDMRFTHVYAGWPGKVHDARVFRRSPLYTEGGDLCGDGHLLGDSAYPNLPFLLVPFRDNGNLTPVQRRYNMVHSSIRSTVERAFGLLKGRFTRLQYLDQRDNKTTVATVLAGCVLHNLCIINHDDFEDFVLDNDVPIPQCQANVENFDANDQEAAAIKRLNIARGLAAN